MPSYFLSPFQELDDALCKTFLSLNLNEDDSSPDARRFLRFQRTFSACPIALSASGFEATGSAVHPGDTVTPHAATAGLSDPAWPLQQLWGRDSELPATSLQRIPFRADRSASLIESCHGDAKPASSRYKTELCRTFEESGTCKYGAKCQFAHGAAELRGLSRHPKYKTEPCRTFHTSGICPYGARCHFIHNAEERRLPPPRAPNPLPTRHCPAADPLPPLTLHGPRLPETSFPCDALSQPTLACPLRATGASGAARGSLPCPFTFPALLTLQKSLSADSLSDQEDSGSSGGSSGSESPGLGLLGRRLPIFSQISVSDD
nr:mRNA decay activator protein ZFP36L2-B-like [Zootoca vivipara]